MGRCRPWKRVFWPQTGGLAKCFVSMPQQFSIAWTKVCLFVCLLVGWQVGRLVGWMAGLAGPMMQLSALGIFAALSTIWKPKLEMECPWQTLLSF